MAKTKAKQLTTVTLRQVEEAHPCRDEYAALLRDLRSNPAEGGEFEPGGYNPLVEYGVKLRRKPKYGPDEPIELAVVLNMKSSGSFDGAARVWWALAHIPHLAKLGVKVTDRREEIEEGAPEQAIREALE